MTATHTKLTQIAKQASARIARLNGESEGFEVLDGDLIAFVDYEAEYRETRGGDTYCGMWETTAELVRETITVAAVWDTEGNEYPELAETLQLLLNR